MNKKLFAKDLAHKLLLDYKEWLEEKDTDLEEPKKRIDTLELNDMAGELLTVESMTVRTCVDYEQKYFISTIDYGIEITVEYKLAGVYFDTRTQTKIVFTDEIFGELLKDLQTELDRRFITKGRPEE